MANEQVGTFRSYVPKKFSAERLAIIGKIAKILDEAERIGEIYSVRQVYYQLVQANVIPNKAEEYGKLQSAINDGRLAGLISWTAIEDRGRALRGLRTYTDTDSAVDQLAKAYRRDLWKTQHVRPEVWVEKAALEAVVGSICDKLRVDYYACRGYNSQSEQWAAGQRFASYVRAGQRPIVFHLGDHDPSGLDMTRDNQERLSMFCGVQVQVVRLALNRNQVDELNLPPNPAKMKDARADAYVAEHGRSSWELDALHNDHMRALIKEAVDRVRDDALFDVALKEEAEERRYLTDLARGHGGEE